MSVSEIASHFSFASTNFANKVMMRFGLGQNQAAFKKGNFHPIWPEEFENLLVKNQAAFKDPTGEGGFAFLDEPIAIRSIVVDIFA